MHHIKEVKEVFTFVFLEYVPELVSLRQTMRNTCFYFYKNDKCKAEMLM